jgi:hypothetical protein
VNQAIQYAFEEKFNIIDVSYVNTIQFKLISSKRCLMICFDEKDSMNTFIADY